MTALPEFTERLQSAVEMVAATGDWIRQSFAQPPTAQRKADDTPVTELDIDLEQWLRSRLSARFPDDCFQGEETGTQDGGSGARWLLDPIDGTRSFVRGYGFFSTQLACQIDEVLTLGVSHAPMSAELIYAERGRGAWLGHERLRVSQVADLKRATVSIGNVGSLTAEPKRWQALGDLLSQCERHRGYGDYLHYHMLARGQLDIIVESDINILDIAALTVIVREAGGKVTELDGSDIDLHSRSIVASNGRLHAHVLSQLGAA